MVRACHPGSNHIGTLAGVDGAACGLADVEPWNARVAENVVRLLWEGWNADGAAVGVSGHRSLMGEFCVCENYGSRG